MQNEAQAYFKTTKKNGQTVTTSVSGFSFIFIFWAVFYVVTNFIFDANSIEKGDFIFYVNIVLFAFLAVRGFSRFCKLFFVKSPFKKRLVGFAYQISYVAAPFILLYQGYNVLFASIIGLILIWCASMFLATILGTIKAANK